MNVILTYFATETATATATDTDGTLETRRYSLAYGESGSDKQIRGPYSKKRIVLNISWVSQRVEFNIPPDAI